MLLVISEHFWVGSGEFVFTTTFLVGPSASCSRNNAIDLRIDWFCLSIFHNRRRLRQGHKERLDSLLK